MSGFDRKSEVKGTVPISYYTPANSPIATFSFVNGPTAFSSRRKITNGGQGFTRTTNLHSEHLPLEHNTAADRDASVLQEIKGVFFNASRAFMGLIGGKDISNIRKNNLDSATSIEDADPRVSRSLKRKTSDVSVISKKRTKQTEQESRANKTPQKQIAGKDLEKLDARLDNSFTPEKHSKITFSTKKDPLRWDFAAEGSPLDSKHVPYGSAFFRRKSSKNRSSQNSKSLTARQPSEEISYLRLVFNGHYKAPALIEDQKLEQLRLREEERKNFKNSFKSSVASLTERFKAVLTENLPNVDDNRVLFVRERKIPSQFTSDNNDGVNHRLKFDTSIVTFEEEFKSYEKLINERRKAQKEVRERRQQVTALIPQLTEDSLNDVRKTLQRGDNAVLYYKNNIELKVYDFKTLASKRWLNDTIIEFFMKHIEVTTNRCVAFNSYFYTTLSQRGYQGVRRWMKKKKVQIEDLEKVFAPINLSQSHWALGVIDISKKEISYVDSLSSGPLAIGHAILKDLQAYLVEESKGQLGKDFDLIHKDCPQQPNGFDCGIYVCANALYLSKDAPLSFDYGDIKRMRPYIGHLILSGDNS